MAGDSDMAKGKKTGGRDYRPGESGNIAGIAKGTMISANSFKDWSFKFWKKNKKDFEAMIMSDPDLMMKFLQMLSSFIPRNVQLTGNDGGPVKTEGTFVVKITPSEAKLQ